jgi:hypothetical protein
MRFGSWALGAGLLVTAISACAAIDGTVINKTTGKPQPGATVTLYKLSQAGPEQVESVKSDSQGKFHISKDAEGPGPRLVQASYADVTYNRILPPGSPSNDVTVDVYESSKQPGAAKVEQHMVLVEPVRGELIVSESYVFRNDGKTSYNDPDGGTLKFYLPPAANGAVKVNGTAPQGMPVPQAADKTSAPNVYKVGFPIKPGETRIDVSYVVPFTAPGPFEGKILYKGGPTRLVAPAGVTLKGDGVLSLGQEPRTQATIYEVKTKDFKIEISGTGSLRQAESSEEASQPSFEEIQPKVLGNMKWILALAFGILTLGFILLYRAQVPEKLQASADNSHTPHREKNGRRRR